MSESRLLSATLSIHWGHVLYGQWLNDRRQKVAEAEVSYQPAALHLPAASEEWQIPVGWKMLGQV